MDVPFLLPTLFLLAGTALTLAGAWTAPKAFSLNRPVVFVVLIAVYLAGFCVSTFAVTEVLGVTSPTALGSSGTELFALAALVLLIALVPGVACFRRQADTQGQAMSRGARRAMAWMLSTVVLIPVGFFAYEVIPALVNR